MVAVRRRSWAGVFFVVVLIVCPARAEEPPRPGAPLKADADLQKRLLGMTADQARQLLGPPKRVARQIVSARYVEQWTYDNPAVRIEFDWRKGQEKQIQAVQLLTNGAP
jgi:hypothetical protein